MLETFFDVGLANVDFGKASCEFLSVFRATLGSHDPTVPVEKESRETPNAGADLQHAAAGKWQIERCKVR